MHRGWDNSLDESRAPRPGDVWFEEASFDEGIRLLCARDGDLRSPQWADAVRPVQGPRRYAEGPEWRTPERPQGNGGKYFTDGIWRVMQFCWKSQPRDRIRAKDVLLGLEGPFLGGNTTQQRQHRRRLPSTIPLTHTAPVALTLRHK
jgi:hypothetical protein